jgi:hypothetical protein
MNHFNHSSRNRIGKAFLAIKETKVMAFIGDLARIAFVVARPGVSYSIMFVTPQRKRLGSSVLVPDFVPGPVIV